MPVLFPNASIETHGPARSPWLGLLFVALFLAGSGCSGEETPVEVDLDLREEVSVRLDPDAVTYAYLPQFSHTVSFQRHYLLVRYLEEATGRKYRQVFPDTFDEHMRMVGQGKIDISFSNPFVYVKISDRYGASAFARTVEESGRESFRGEIICRADHPGIGGIEDVRGLRWIAVDPWSAGGYLFPLGMFLHHGIRPEDFAEIAFAPGPGGKQEKVVLAVHAGQFDLGTIREGALEVVADKIDTGGIRVVARTPWYPGWVFAADRRLDPAVVDAVRDAMTALDPAVDRHRQILEAAQIARIIAAGDGDFGAVRGLWKEIAPYDDLAGVVEIENEAEVGP